MSVSAAPSAMVTSFWVWIFHRLGTTVGHWWHDQGGRKLQGGLATSSEESSTAARFTAQQRPHFVDVGVQCEYLAQSSQLSVISLHQPFLLPALSFRTKFLPWQTRQTVFLWMNLVSWAQSQGRRPVASMTISTSSFAGEVSLDRSDESLSLVAPCAVLNESFRADAVSVGVARVEGPGWSSAWWSAGLSAVSGEGGGVWWPKLIHLWRTRTRSCSSHFNVS